MSIPPKTFIPLTDADFNRSFRPKLYFTTGHPSAGEEEPFAEPDNISKMRRSVENAEHVGE